MPARKKRAARHERDPPRPKDSRSDGMTPEAEMLRTGLYTAIGLGHTMNACPGACVFGIGLGTLVICDVIADGCDSWGSQVAPRPKGEPRKEEEG